nr:HNH endonuclease signature motif containing protein [Photorhabdus australis]
MGAPIPSQIADKLRGRRFNNFDDFRKAFWKEVGNDPELIKDFSDVNKRRIKELGYAPFSIPTEQVGGKKKFDIHHVKPIKSGGSVYDIDNLRVVTPKKHIELHSNREGI